MGWNPPHPQQGWKERQTTNRRKDIISIKQVKENNVYHALVNIMKLSRPGNPHLVVCGLPYLGEELLVFLCQVSGDLH